MHEHQADDHGDVADAVDKEAPAFADRRHRDARYRGSDHARGVEHRRVEGNGVDQVFLADHIHDERLARGNVEGVDYAEKSGEHEHVPDADGVSQGEERQRKG